MRVECDAEQVPAKVQRRRGIRFPQPGFTAPEPHLPEVADGVGARRGRPCDRAQARRLVPAARSEQAFGRPALFRLEAGHLALVADRERFAGERAFGLTGRGREREQGVPEGRGPSGQAAGNRFQRQVHREQFLAQPALVRARERRSVAAPDVAAGARGSPERQHTREPGPIQAQAHAVGKAGDDAFAETFRGGGVGPREAPRTRGWERFGEFVRARGRSRGDAAPRHEDPAREFAFGLEEHRRGHLHVGAPTVDPHAFAGHRQHLRLDVAFDRERLFEIAFDGKRFAGFPARLRDHRLPRRGFFASARLATEQGDRPSVEPCEHPCVPRRARADREHLELAFVGRRYFNRLARPAFAVPVKHAVFVVGFFVDRHHQSPGVPAGFVERDDHRRAIDAEQAFAFAQGGFAFGRKRSGFLEGSAGVAHEQHLLFGAFRCRRAREHAAAVGRHLSRQRARAVVFRGFRLVEPEAGERLTARVEQAGRQRPARFGCVAHERRRAVLASEAPCLVGRLRRRGPDHRHPGRRDRRVGLRRGFPGRAGLAGGAEAPVLTRQADQQRDRQRDGRDHAHARSTPAAPAGDRFRRAHRSTPTASGSDSSSARVSGKARAVDTLFVLDPDSRVETVFSGASA